jgi:hypothetical protein
MIRTQFNAEKSFEFPGHRSIRNSATASTFIASRVRMGSRAVTIISGTRYRLAGGFSAPEGE